MVRIDRVIRLVQSLLDDVLPDQSRVARICALREMMGKPVTGPPDRVCPERDLDQTFDVYATTYTTRNGLTSTPISGDYFHGAHHLLDHDQSDYGSHHRATWYCGR